MKKAELLNSHRYLLVFVVIVKSNFLVYNVSEQ